MSVPTTQFPSGKLVSVGLGTFSIVVVFDCVEFCVGVLELAELSIIITKINTNTQNHQRL
jgi:hypothetical protein